MLESRKPSQAAAVIVAVATMATSVALPVLVHPWLSGTGFGWLMFGMVVLDAAVVFKALDVASGAAADEPERDGDDTADRIVEALSRGKITADDAVRLLREVRAARDGAGVSPLL